MRSRRLAPALCSMILLLAGCAANPTPTPTPAPAPVASKAARPASRASGKAERGSPEVAIALVRKGLQANESGDVRAAAGYFQQALAADPDNRAALRNLAQLAERLAMSLPRPASSPYYLRSAEMIRRLRAVYPDLTPEERGMLPNILYNEACTFAIDGESARAVVALSEAIEAGFLDLSHIEVDAELDTLRGLPDFQVVTHRLEERIVRAMIAATKPSPFQFALNDLDGKAVSVADFRGKILVVDFWGTWCPPSRKEVPHLVELEKRYRDKGLAVVGLAYENEQGDEARKAIRAFAKEVGISYPCPIANDALLNQVPGFTGYPTTLFLDREGRIRLKFSGYQPLSTLEIAAAALLGENQEVGRKERKMEKEKEKEKGKARAARGF